MSQLIARQPICNETLKVIGFELLHRMNNAGNHAVIHNSDSATIDVLLAAYNDLSIGDVVGNQLAFVNFTSNIIMNQLPPISAKQLVIELLEGEEVTPELIKALKHLRRKGYKIALDDFCLNKETLSLIDCADIIKLDVLQDPPAKWAPYIPKLRDRGIIMLAEKVENYDVYEECRELGFTLFQGFFFAKPKILAGKKMSQNAASIMNLIDVLNQDAIEYDQVVQVIAKDVSLSYSLLRAVNSGMFPISSKIESIKQAAVTLGINHLKKWANFMALSSLDNKPAILIESAMLRAKMCELLGEHITGKEAPDGFFTIGLFSMLDAFFDVPLEKILKKVSLNKEINDAILYFWGIKGCILKTVIDYEQQNEWDVAHHKMLRAHNINQDIITHSYLQSVQWCNENRF